MQYPPQSTLRGRVEIGGVFLPSAYYCTLLYIFVRDGRYSERGRA
jgi:hypothetical protein